MANPKRSRSQNVSGDFYVDDTCIDCDTCRWMAPGIFKSAGGQSAVYRQPQSPEEREQALHAVVACPTASIGVLGETGDMPRARKAFPLPLDENVFACGYHSRKSFGAASYLIRRDTGNVLVDSPRYSATLADRLEEMGGVQYLYLTHGDDVADHQAYRDRFGCLRILHRGDMDAGTSGVEIPLDGDEPVELDKDLVIIPVPGHTEGHTVLLHRGKYLFTGDHLAYSVRLGHLYAFRSACWYSWEECLRSMEKLREYTFEWVLPGHGRKFQAPSSEMPRHLEDCIAWMKAS